MVLLSNLTHSLAGELLPSNSFSTFQAEALSRGMALVLDAPDDDLIDTVVFTFTSIQGTPGTWKYGLQGLDSNGFPNGTWSNDGGGEASGTISGASLNVNGNALTLDNDYQASRGEPICIVFWTESGTHDFSNKAIMRYAVAPINGDRLSVYPAVCTNTLGTWTIQDLDRNPCMGYRAGSVSRGWPISSSFSRSYGPTTDPDEAGFKMVPPQNIWIHGFYANVFSAVTDCDVKLIEGTTTLETVSLIGEEGSSAERRMCYFSKPYKLLSGNTYYLSGERKGANMTLYETDFLAAQDMMAMMPYSWCTPVDRTDLGAWTEATTKFYNAVPVPLIEFTADLGTGARLAFR